ncbi:hypothetical protein L2E82_20046 [Cichorium intybus]|uniref:Uncharacterized protein n=1 Tax=Cichorium intybus TaxID=13427 RepID=A0ACB9DS09_CICIN|nr:hypothetical protein L2E82_20046 [Cichorium intybus]
MSRKKILTDEARSDVPFSATKFFEETKGKSSDKGINPSGLEYPEGVDLQDSMRNWNRRKMKMKRWGQRGKDEKLKSKKAVAIAKAVEEGCRRRKIHKVKRQSG